MFLLIKLLRGYAGLAAYAGCDAAACTKAPGSVGKRVPSLIRPQHSRSTRRRLPTFFSP
jgi:hypothetical protein